ncbi:MAG: 50S ribosomal protein L18 [Saprospiraceae bacterium]|nr:50S ribosomal protein L18 [Saprospiraceae bacterium]
MAFNKQGRRRTIRYRIRNKVKGSSNRPRLSVYRSNRAIYCQLIDDSQGTTIAQASSREVENASKVDQAKQVGALLAERAKQKNITHVRFDRGGYLYHGRVKALAEGVRENGLVL